MHAKNAAPLLISGENSAINLKIILYYLRQCQVVHPIHPATCIPFNFCCHGNYNVLLYTYNVYMLMLPCVGAATLI